MICDKINQFLIAESKDIPQAILDEVGELAKHSFARQFGKREDKPGTLRLSSIGKCTRAQSYKLLGFEEDGKEIDARAKMVFFMGDLVELAVTQLAIAAGCNITDYGLNQKTVEIDGIMGHPDGIIHNGKDTLLEVKSMSSYSFQNFQNQQIDDGYRYQMNSYMHALNLDQCCIVGLNKDAGVLHEWIIKKDEEIVNDIKKRIATLKIVTKETLPERPYSPNEKGFLPWQCRYCSAYNTCWPGSELVLVGKAYKLRVKTAAVGAISDDSKGTYIDE